MSCGSLTRLRPIREYLRSKFITVSDQWITNQLNANNTISNETVYQNWLNCDLKRISSGSDVAKLPIDSNQIKVDQQTQSPLKTTLYGKYVLQINSMEDISRPKVLSAVDALDDERNSGSESSENESENQTRLFKKRKTEPKKKKKEVTKRGARLLSMVLTDGVTDCKAIEYEAIACLTENTPVGSKLLISGPLDIYTAVMFLSPSNVKVLGGSIPLDNSVVSGGGNDRTDTPLRTLFPQTSSNC